MLVYDNECVTQYNSFSDNHLYIYRTIALINQEKHE